MKRIRIVNQVEPILAMANLDPKHTKLRSTLYARFNGKVFETDHNDPHIHVEVPNSKKGVPILIGPKSEILLKPNRRGRLQKEDYKLIEEAIAYVESYHEIFMQHWLGELTDYELQLELFGDRK